MSEEVPELPPHWRPGSMIAGRFRVERVLGQGGMGAVVEAENVTLGQRVALKVLRHELVNNREALARFDREAKVVSQLVTENVVRVHDLGRTEQGEPFIVMELLSGRTLEDVIDAPAQLPIEQAVDLACEACVGLAVAHAAGIVHRDVKPSNLFETRRSDGTSVVKVLDFGVTKITRADTMNLTQTASVFGTPLYMSPEQIMSSKTVDARSDQHAMGVVLFELLTKQVPYYDEQPTAVTVKIATVPPPKLREIRADIPNRLDAAVRRSLAKMPDERFPDIAAFTEAIAPFGSERAKLAAARAAQALGRVPLPPVLTESLTPPPHAPVQADAAPSPPHTSRAALTAGLGALVIAATVVLLLVRPGSGPDRTRTAGDAVAEAQREPLPSASAPAPSALDPSALDARAGGGAVGEPLASASAAPSTPSDPPPAASAAASAAKPATTTKPARPATTARPKPTATGGGEFIPTYKK